MRIDPSIYEDHLHDVRLSGKPEARRVARAVGLKRWSGFKLFVSAVMPAPGGEPVLGFIIDTKNLQTLNEKLDPPALELRNYLAELTLQFTLAEDVSLDQQSANSATAA